MMSHTFIGLLLGLLGLLVVLYLFSRKKRPGERVSGEQIKHNIEQWGECGGCGGCSGHCCDSGERVRSERKVAAEYFDDEELDRFAGRSRSDYTPAEIEEFREVLVTLLPSDVPLWQQSLALRGIALPEALDTLMAERLQQAAPPSH